MCRYLEKTNPEEVGNCPDENGPNANRNYSFVVVKGRLMVECACEENHGFHLRPPTRDEQDQAQKLGLRFD